MGVSFPIVSCVYRTVSVFAQQVYIISNTLAYTLLIKSTNSATTASLRKRPRVADSTLSVLINYILSQ